MKLTQLVIIFQFIFLIFTYLFILFGSGGEILKLISCHMPCLKYILTVLMHCQTN